ncbi:hypothetical protein BVY03_00350 [bacterium K02(2017)]|nr:hypothetical protein BVY03_00350 [bacterium K02(2017)]
MVKKAVTNNLINSKLKITMSLFFMTVFLMMIFIPATSKAETKFYLNNAAADVTPGIKDTTWDDITTYDSIKMSTTKSGTVTSNTGVDEDAGANPWDVLNLQLVSDPVTAQTIDGTVNIMIGVDESNGQMNGYFHAHMYVVQSDGTSIRGILLNNYAESSTEWNVADDGQTFDGGDQTLSSVSAQDNDRIVVEIGFVARNTKTTAYNGVMWYGGTGSDLTDGGDGTSLPGFVEFADYITFMQVTGSFQKVSDTAGSFTAVLDDQDNIGRALADIGDLDGDGIRDLITGVIGDDDGGSARGAAYVLFMKTDGTVSSFQKISDTVGSFTAVLDDSDKFGNALAEIGDLDGDGIQEIAVAAYQDGDGGFEYGAVYVLFMQTDGSVNSFQKISDTAGEFTATFNTSDFFGVSVEGIGDLNGDGINDIAVGAFQDDDGGQDRGALYVLFLKSTGVVNSFQKISDTVGSFTASLDNFNYFGSSITHINDLDGDGIADLAVGAYGDADGGTDRGAVFVLFMNTDGTVSSFQKISDTDGSFVAVLDDSDFFGRSIVNAGDVDGDGAIELLVGASSDDDGGTDRGAAYLLYLNTSGTVSAYKKISNTEGGFTAVLDNSDNFGISVAALKDANEDGVLDVAVGAYLDDDGASGRGAFYSIYLNSTFSVGALTINSHPSVANNLTEVKSNFTLTITTDGTIPVNGDIDIIFPVGFNLANVGSGDVSEVDSDGGTLTTSINVLRMTINVGSQINPGTELDLTISNVGNPSVAQTTSTFLIQTQNASDGLIDEGVGNGITIINSFNSFQKISDTEGSFTAILDNADYFGYSVANIGDLDGDGIIDLASGAVFDSDGGTNRGAVFVLFMNTDGTVNSFQKISDTAGSFTAVLDNSDKLGWSVASLGDVNGDSIQDLAVGTIEDDDGSTNRGAVYVLFMKTNGTVNSFQKISDTAGDFTAVIDDGDSIGWYVEGLGDLNGDAIGDLAIGVRQDDDGGGDRGAVYITFLNTDGQVKSFQKISDTAGGFTATLDNNDYIGDSVNVLNDLNGDGIPELVVGTSGDDDGGVGSDIGAVYILFMNTDGTVQSFQKISHTEGNFSENLEQWDVLGRSVASLGDLDGNGAYDSNTHHHTSL